MIFPSKVDWWIALALMSLPVACIAAAAVEFSNGNSTNGIYCLAGLGGSIVFYWCLVLPTNYELTDDQLIVRSGMIRYRIKYEDIRGVRPSRNILSAPALSLQRLHVDHGKMMLISPDRPAVFLDELAIRAAHLERRDDRVVTVREA